VKLSISLPAEDIEFLDEYARASVTGDGLEHGEKPDASR
jgi:hypothetical protein